MSWLEEMFGVKKPVIAMCHLQPMPGDPNYDEKVQYALSDEG